MGVIDSDGGMRMTDWERDESEREGREGYGERGREAENGAEHEAEPKADDRAEPLDDEALNAMIETICNSKADEFRMLGYDSVTGKDVWDCVSSKYKELPPLHKLVNDIMSLRATGLMNWMTLSAWKQAEREPKP